MALMSSSRLIIVRGESSRPRREGLTRCPQSMISIVVGQTDPIPSYLCRQKSKDFSANPNSFNPNSSDVGRKAQQGPKKSDRRPLEVRKLVQKSDLILGWALALAMAKASDAGGPSKLQKFGRKSPVGSSPKSPT